MMRERDGEFVRLNSSLLFADDNDRVFHGIYVQLDGMIDLDFIYDLASSR